MNPSAALPELPGTEIEPRAESVAPAWGLAKRIVFRFVLAYLVLYNLPFPLDLLPVAAKGIEAYQNLWHSFVPWVGRHLLGIEITVRPNGSGDTTYNYVQVLCYLVIAAGAALVWMLLDRKRPHYGRLYEWLRVYIRFALAGSMMTYGAYKIIPSQFSSPSFDALFEPYGQASPMGILWTFMGASLPYTMFTGWAEMIGGLLLVARRTTLLGALVCIGVMSNVVMLNLSYDVPVKLFSSHLLLMAVFLVVPDLGRLLNVLVLNREAEPAPIRPLFRTRALNAVAMVLPVLFVAVVAGQSLYNSYDAASEYGHLAPKPPMYGLWKVEEFEMDGRVVPPLVTEKARWQWVTFEWTDVIVIMKTDGYPGEGYATKLDAVARRLELSKFREPAWKSELFVRKTGQDRLELHGTFDGKKVRAGLRRVEKASFPLVGRGFHWINEYPYNR